MLGNIKSNKTIWIIAGVIVISIIAVLTFISIQKQSQRDLPTELQSIPTAHQPLSDDELEKIAEAAINSNPTLSSEDDFASLIDSTLLDQPIPEDSALVKDELSQLKDIQSQLKEQKDILEQQHVDADQLLKLKEQQLAALEKQL